MVVVFLLEEIDVAVYGVILGVKDIVLFIYSFVGNENMFWSKDRI